MNEAQLSAMALRNIISGFHNTGIYPHNREIFSETDSMQSQSGTSGCHERVCACVQRLQTLTEDLQCWHLLSSSRLHLFFRLTLFTLLTTSFRALVWHACLDIFVRNFLVLACLFNLAVPSFFEQHGGPGPAACCWMKWTVLKNPMTLVLHA